MANFKLANGRVEGMPMKTLAKASATVILPGDMVGLTNGLAVKAGASTAAIARCPNGGVTGETTVQILDDRDAEFYGTGSQVHAVTDRAYEADMSITGTTQLINLSASSVDVFKVSVGTDSGTVGSADNVKVKINKFLY